MSTVTTASPAGAATRTVHRALVWTGPTIIGVLVVGMIPLARFVPPPSPAAPASAIAALFTEHTTGIRVACVLMMVMFSCWSVWAGVLIAWVRRIEPGLPVLTYGCLASAGAGTVFFTIAPLTWTVAAFRPDGYEPDTIRALNDWAWFGILFTWPPFAVLCALVAVAVLTDGSARPVFPRWVGYYNAWEAVMLVPFCLISFFKTGPFAWDGAFGFYLPAAAFCVWIGIMSRVLLRAIRADG